MLTKIAVAIAVSIIIYLCAFLWYEGSERKFKRDLEAHMKGWSEGYDDGWDAAVLWLKLHPEMLKEE